MVDRLFKVLTSLRLTVVCLGLALILVFVGTLAEVHMGLYQAQSEIFRSFFVHWTPPGTHWRVPVFPGGWLIGLVLLVNLLAAHIKRFQLSRKKIGIILIHGGLILLLAGQFVTEVCQVESQMILEVGGTKNYTEDSREHELAVMDVTAPGHDSVVAIPESLVARGGDITAPTLPFTLRVKNYAANSALSGPMMSGEKLQASRGIGRRLVFTGIPEAKAMDDENKPTAVVEALADHKSLGDWTVSLWLSKHPLLTALEGELSRMGLNLPVGAPQGFTLGGHRYQLALRARRYYKPYAITLLDFNHDLYLGTDIPSNFSSKIHLDDPARGEDRDVLIRMNNPLRYRGETFYQASFEPGDKVSILQVVRNPAAITPYVACGLVALGLVVQFLMHLVGFARKRAQQVRTIPARGKPAGPILEPALARKRSEDL